MSGCPTPRTHTDLENVRRVANPAQRALWGMNGILEDEPVLLGGARPRQRPTYSNA